MPKGLRPYYNTEIALYREHMDSNNFENAWRRLERCHIMGQPWALEHTQVHWLMLKFGFRIKSLREITGQIPRLLIGGVKSFVGKIPVGNTGGASVPPLRSMEIPSDIHEVMKPFLH
jgi:hypothetical protein